MHIPIVWYLFLKRINIIKNIYIYFKVIKFEIFYLIIYSLI